ncbi:MAG: pyridoxamine 5'-phosphate oxidase [Chlamydiales bacterium]|jgi:pyridoxamine 5'-phosphate oxidase
MKKEYSLITLRKKDVKENPIEQFKQWMDEAVEAEILEANAISLATSTSEGKPSVRTVLIKSVNDRGIVFFTNYESRKAQDIKENPFAAMSIWWKEMERQVCIEGSIEKISREESEEYFNTRSRGSRIGAWTSKQSSVLGSREELEGKYSSIEKKYPGEEIPAPPFWGGYLLNPTSMEFWQGRPKRLHDRILYTRKNGSWEICRLSP